MSSPKLQLAGVPPRVTNAGIICRAILWVLLFLAIGIGGDYLADRLGLEHDLLYLNDVVSAIVIGLLIILYENRRRRRMQERLEIIEQMNHHVRNALQLISLSPHAHQREEHLAMIQQAVDRIDWALREVLPGTDVAVIRANENTAPEGLKPIPRPTR